MRSAHIFYSSLKLLLFLLWGMAQNPIIGYAQKFGGVAPSTRWMQIDTDTARIIFPIGLELQAQRVANNIHKISKSHYPKDTRQKKINITLQNLTVIPDAYTDLAPLRSEYNLSPPQNGNYVGSNWLETVSINEYRQAQQLFAANKGLTRVGRVLFGQSGWQFFNNLSIPTWYREGDAIYCETAFTNQGRGRLPAFYTGIKSLMYDEIYYSYDKIRNGSLKDFVPQEAESGFLMVNYGINNFKDQAWDDILNESGRYKGLFYPFSRNLRKHTEYPTYDFYIMSLRYYNSLWDSVKTISSVTPVSQLNNIDKNYTFTRYRYPYIQDNDEVVVYKESYKQIGAFYSINRYGTEVLITRPGRMIDNYYAYKNKKLVWTEIGQHERWGWQVNSNIVIYDMSLGTKNKLTKSTKYFSPDITSDGQTLVAVQISQDQKQSIHILSSTDGSIIKALPNPDGYTFAYPKWSDSEERIILVVRDEHGRNALGNLNIVTGELDVFFGFSDHQIGVPVESDDKIFFSATFDGIDNIYAFNKADSMLLRVTNELIGAYDPMVDAEKNRLYFTDFTNLGSDVKYTEIDTSSWLSTTITEPGEIPIYHVSSLADSTEANNINKSISTYPTSKYARLSNLINIHSWSPEFEDPNFEFALRSNNILNTLRMNLGVRYNRNEENFTYFYDASFAQYYPVLNFSFSAGRRAGLSEGIRVNWWENKISGGVLLPWDLSKGLYTSNLSLFSNYNLTSIKFDETDGLLTTDFTLHSLQTGISFLNKRKKAVQNIFSKNSQYIKAELNNSIDEFSGNQLFVDSEWTFPGVSQNHNLVFQVAYQREDNENDYQFIDNFFYSRGYNPPFYDYIYKIGSNYHLPLLYPDKGLWGIVYFYRIRTNLFFDYSRSHLTDESSNRTSVLLYNSTGIELIFDTRLFNYYDFSIGARYAYLLNKDPQDTNLKHAFQVFIPILRF